LLLLAPRPAGLSLPQQWQKQQQQQQQHHRQQVRAGHPPLTGVGKTRVSTININKNRTAATRKSGRSVSTPHPLPPPTFPPVAVTSSSSITAAAASAAATRKRSLSSAPSPPPPPPATVGRTNSYGTKLLFKNQGAGTFLDIFLNAPPPRSSSASSSSSIGNNNNNNNNAAVMSRIRQHPSDILIPDNGVDAAWRLQPPTAAADEAKLFANQGADGTTTATTTTLIATHDIADTDICSDAGP
jgi:hypothetical protein